MRVRDLGYTADVRALWAELDDDNSGFITLNELDHDAAVDLQAFRDATVAKYGSMLAAFDKWDEFRQRRLDLDDWVYKAQEVCKASGVDGERAFELFNLEKSRVIVRQVFELTALEPLFGKYRPQDFREKTKYGFQQMTQCAA